MDRSGHHLLSVDSLQHALRQRADGRWAFLAAAAGRPESIDELALAVSSRELDRGSAGAAVTPSLVSERVEALAVSARPVLVRVAIEWRKPAATGSDPFWSAAWNAALRHLAGEMDLNPEDFRPSAVASEAAIVWPNGDKDVYTWNELLTRCRDGVASYEQIRRWATHPLGDRRIREEQVTNAPSLLLRVLRDRVELLTADAVASLNARVEVAGEDPFEVAILAELLACVDDSIADNLREQVLSILPTVTDPREVIPLAYVLLGQHWVVP